MPADGKQNFVKTYEVFPHNLKIYFEHCSQTFVDIPIQREALLVYTGWQSLQIKRAALFLLIAQSD